MAKLYNTRSEYQDQIDFEKENDDFWNPWISLSGVYLLGVVAWYLIKFFLAKSYDELPSYKNTAILAIIGLIPFLISSRCKNNAHKLSGVQKRYSRGHDKFVRQINDSFSDEYHALFSVYVQNEKKESKKIDCVLVGPTGVFIIGFSTANGDIQGSINYDTWNQYKIGRKGTPYEGHGVRNPIKTLNYQSFLLKQIFAQRGWHLFVNNYFMFINCSKLSLYNVTNCFDDFNKLKTRIVSMNNILSPHQVEQIVEIIIDPEK